MTIKELYEKRAGVYEQMKAITVNASKENRELTKEELDKWDKINDDHDLLTRQIKAFETDERIDKETAKIIEVEEAKPLDKKELEQKQNDVFLKFFKYGLSELEPGERKIIAELRANAQSTADGKGGYTIPTGFRAIISEALAAYGGMLSEEGGKTICQHIMSDSGNDLPWPTDNDTANMGYLLSEAGNAETSAEDVDFSLLTLHAYKYTSGLLRISSELITDSAFDFVNWLKRKLAVRIWRRMNYDLTVGTGSSQPNGVVTASTLGVTATVSTITRNNLVDLLHSVDPAYRRNGRWMFEDATLKYIKKLVDGNSLPLYQVSVRVGEPDTIEGYPFTINQDMASIAASAKTILFGDFSNYLIREVKSVVMRRLIERFADTDQEGVVAFHRFDGELDDAGTHPIKYLQHAAS